MNSFNLLELRKIIVSKILDNKNFSCDSLRTDLITETAKLTPFPQKCIWEYYHLTLSAKRQSDMPSPQMCIWSFMSLTSIAQTTEWHTVSSKVYLRIQWTNSIIKMAECHVVSSKTYLNLHKCYVLRNCRSRRTRAFYL